MIEHPQTDTLLSVDDLVVDYGRGARRFRAVDGVSFAIGAGETLGLVGESGSGKSTIAKVLVGMVKATAGTASFDGEDLVRVTSARRRKLASDLQMVFQDPYSSLNPAKTIGQALAEPFIAQPHIRASERRERVGEMLERVGMPASTVEKYPSHLSGGQRQRIAIARALVLKPRLVICDEPVSALDLSIQAQILNLLADLQDDLGVSYLFVAHNLSVVRHIADRVLVLYRGQEMESGEVDQVYTHPAHPYTRALLASEPVSDPVLQRRRREAEVATTVLQPRSQGLGGCVFQSRCPHVVDECGRSRPPRVDLGDDHGASCMRLDELTGLPISPTPQTVSAVPEK